MDIENVRFDVGDFKCIAVLDGTFRYPAAMFFTNMPKERYQILLRQCGQPADEIEIPYTCLCIDTGDDLILVDSGSGAGVPSAGKLLSRLHAEGIEPRDIGTVILSHAHPDHIGGNLDEHGKPAFPNAQYVIWKEEWDFWLSRPSLVELQVDDNFKEILLASAERNLSGIEAQVYLVNEEIEILPGIRIIQAPGHTPGHIAVGITSGVEQLLYLGDAVCHPLHIEYPGTRLATDLQPMNVVRSRRQLLNRATREATLVHSYHFPYPGLGRVTAKGDGWQWWPSSTGA